MDLTSYFDDGYLLEPSVMEDIKPILGEVLKKKSFKEIGPVLSQTLVKTSPQ